MISKCELVGFRTLLTTKVPHAAEGEGLRRVAEFEDQEVLRELGAAPVA